MEEELLNREQIAAELETVRQASDDGRLHAEQIVEWARTHRQSALHGQFEWSDRDAAKQWRLEQARQIIRVVVIQSNEPPRRIRAYVSRPSDRAHGGGYSPTAEAVVRARGELVARASATVRRLRDRYTHLPELDVLFDEINAAVTAYVEGRATRAAA